MNNIEFEFLDSNFNDYDLLYEWCQKEYVYEWFEQRKLSYEEVKNKYENKINDINQTIILIKIDSKRVGLIQYYKSDYDKLNIDNLYEYDLFIADNDYLNKGYGKRIFSKLNSHLFKDKKAGGIILRPFKRNIRSSKTCEKYGTKIDEYKGFDTIGNEEIIEVYLVNKEN